MRKLERIFNGENPNPGLDIPIVNATLKYYWDVRLMCKTQHEKR